MSYTLSQWILIFFTYCFVGWVWECCLVSFKQREWVNRGFLYGPWLPIYGFGAIIILFITLPFEESILLIFLLGSIGASILEYVTGAVMEQLFGVRYWDYSHHKFNINGHISLVVSLGWGAVSVLLVKLIHPPVKDVIIQIPDSIAQAVSLVLTIVFVVDVTKSTQDALDMKQLLAQLAENNKGIAALELKVNEITAAIDETSDKFKKNIQVFKAEAKENFQNRQSEIKAHNKSNKAFILEKLQGLKYTKSKLIDILNKKADTTIVQTQLELDASSSEKERAQLSKTLKNLNEFKASLKKLELNSASIKDKEYKSAANVTRKYPSAVSKRFKDALEEIKTLNKTKKDK